jgi:hypothetical protein
MEILISCGDIGMFHVGYRNQSVYAVSGTAVNQITKSQQKIGDYCHITTTELVSTDQN